MDETNNNDMNDSTEEPEFELEADDTAELEVADEVTEMTDIPDMTDVDADTFTADNVDADSVQDNPMPDEAPEPEPRTVFTEPPVGDPAFTSPPPVAPIEDRLVRDPHATFGGVLSGIAHRYGWDVALTRLAFIVVLLLSGGSAIFAYAIAWLVIPRASMWPPAVASGGRPSRRSGGISTRDIGIGVLGLAALVTLGVGAGEAGAILVPLALIGAGVWLLMQSPRTASPDVAGVASPGVAAASAPIGVYDSAWSDASPMPPQPPSAPVTQQPVNPRSRARRFAKVGLLGLVGLFLLSIIAVPLIIIGVITNGDFDISSDDRVLYEPAFELPSVIDEDAGELIVDLRNFDFSQLDAPHEMRINLDAGRMEVVLPEDLRVDIEANVDIGEMNILGRSADGINTDLSFGESDEMLILDLEVDLGQIEVFRDDDRTIPANVTVEINQ